MTFAIDHANAFQVRVQLAHGGSRNILQRRLADSGPQVKPLTWDDESTAVYAADSPAGTYRPDQPLSVHDGTGPGSRWTVQVDNWREAKGRVESWSIRISYTVRDADADGAEDHTDNCTGLANPDQADRDADGIGDACDGDLDGNGVVGGSDNCPAVFNPTQTATDSDALGDASRSVAGVADCGRSRSKTVRVRR